MLYLNAIGFVHLKDTFAGHFVGHLKEKGIVVDQKKQEEQLKRRWKRAACRGKQLNDRLKTQASGNPSWTPYVDRVSKSLEP